ncbi:MAG: hypothetical protein RL087_1913 [Pseudomonadota bacterium]
MTTALDRNAPAPAELVDSRTAWMRLWVTLALMTVGASGMYVVPVVLPSVQAEFGITRADASLPYTLLMIGFGVGGIWMGRMADRHGVARPLMTGGLCLGLGYIAAALSGNIYAFAIAHGVLIGLCGSSATFSPLLADTSLWFLRRRGIAVAVCASGNYLGGTIWPPIVQHFVQEIGWRNTYWALGIFSTLVMVSLAQMMRQRPPALAALATPAKPASASPSSSAASAAVTDQAPGARPFGLPPAVALALLSVAGVGCCVAMSMPQVHIVAYCADLGYGVARGAEMLSLMLAFGIVSRLISGAICDRIGGLRTLLLGSILQGTALLLFIPFDGLVSLYLISALFGLFQGGIVPSYAIIVREYFSPAKAGAMVGTVIMCTMLGMALGGWMSGKVFDLTGSYHAAFINGVAWNGLNLLIVLYLLRRVRLARRNAQAAAA